MALGLGVSSFATELEEYASENSPVLTKQQERRLHDQIEKEMLGTSKSGRINNKEKGGIYYIDVPMDGSTDIETYRYSTGKIFVQEVKGEYSEIEDEYILITNLLPITGIINSVLGYFEGELENNSYVEVVTSLSYSYFGKNGIVYANNRWNTHWKTECRETFKHIVVSAVTTAGYTETEAIDYTRPNGYEPILLEMLAHYDDDQEIRKRAYSNYLKGYWYYQAEFGWPY